MLSNKIKIFRSEVFGNKLLNLVICKQLWSFSTKYWSTLSILVNTFGVCHLKCNKISSKSYTNSWTRSVKNSNSFPRYLHFEQHNQSLSFPSHGLTIEEKYCLEPCIDLEIGGVIYL